MTGLSVKESYPFYALPVLEFLKLNTWVDHQTLLAQSKLVRVEPDDAQGEVIFCSHQWLSFDHPDPACEQLKALQAIIRRLMAGETSVASNAMLEGIYGYKMLTTRQEWAAKLKSMLLWVDYISVPQPGALVKNSHVSEVLVEELNMNKDGHVSMHELVDADLSNVTEQLHRRGSDARLMGEAGGCDESITSLVEQLKRAVDSIPSYIERSSMMWVVVPPCKHQDLKDVICDFASWRRRGWCRMEFAASKLACGEDMPLMVIKSAVEAPEYFNPCDIFKLCPARGAFTVHSDKDKVSQTLSTMLAAKAEWYEKHDGDMTLARLLRAFSPIFVPREAYGTAAIGGLPQSSALERLKQFMNWRDDTTEAKWIKESGWNLLTLAATLNDEAVVDELLQRPPPEVRAMLDAKGAKMVVAGNSSKGAQQRREPLGQKLCQYAEGMSPLMAAMTFASASIVRKLVEAGANVERDGLLLLGERPCTFRGAAIAGRAENVRFLLERFPRYTNAVNEYGACALHFAAASSECLGQREVVRALLDAGAKASISQTHLFMGTPLSAACSTFDQDPEAVRMMLEAGADPARPEKLSGKGKMIKRVSTVMKRLGSTQMGGINRLLSASVLTLKQTPTHAAAQRGDIALVRLLVEHAQFDEGVLRDGNGCTPIQLCERAAAPNRDLPQLMQKALSEAMPDGPAVGRDKFTEWKRSRRAHGKAKWQVAPISTIDETPVKRVAEAIEQLICHHPSSPLRQPHAPP